jgi:DNA-binding MarR family transcriptional regulator
MANEFICIAGRLRLLSRVATGMYNEAFAPTGTTFAQAVLLMRIFARPGIRQAELSRQLQIEKSALSRDVQLLQRNGWLADDRQRGLFLTDEGSRVAKQSHKIWKALTAEMHDKLGPEAVQGLALLSQQLLAIQTINPKTIPQHPDDNDRTPEPALAE